LFELVKFPVRKLLAQGCGIFAGLIRCVASCCHSTNVVMTRIQSQRQRFELVQVMKLHVGSEDWNVTWGTIDTAGNWI